MNQLRITHINKRKLSEQWLVLSLKSDHFQTIFGWREGKPIWKIGYIRWFGWKYIQN